MEFIQPILLPLSDLTKEIEVNGEKFLPIDILSGETYFDYELTKSNKLVEVPFFITITPFHNGVT